MEMKYELRGVIYWKKKWAQIKEEILQRDQKKSEEV
jgi:hypothetical protein